MNPIRPWLYVGGYRDTRNRSLLAVNRIEAMLQLAEPVDQPGIVALFLPVEDLAPIPFPLLEQGVAFVRDHKSRERRVLIACGAGINRSCAFAVAALKEEEKLGLLDAFRELQRRHRDAMPHPPVWESLCRYYGEDVPYPD